jgi:hypothetical protein
MTYPSVEQQLGWLEEQFNSVSSAIIDGDPDKVLAACAALQERAVSMLKNSEDLYSQSQLDARLVVRLQALSQSVSPVRESLARRFAYVQRALELVVPGGGGDKATYSGPAGAVGVANPYGGPVRQSGQFKFLSA